MFKHWMRPCFKAQFRGFRILLLKDDQTVGFINKSASQFEKKVLFNSTFKRFGSSFNCVS